MKTGQLSALFVITAILLSATCLLAQQTPPAEVLQAATEGLQPYLQKIPAGTQEQYGFADGDDLSAATLGDPFQLNTITPAALEKYQAGMAVASVITPTTTWGRICD